MNRARTAVLMLLWLALGASGCGGASTPRPAEASNNRLGEIMRMVDDGLNEQARIEVDALIAAGEQHPHLWWCDAQLHFRAGAFATAALRCERLIGNAPWWIEPRILLAQAYQGDGRFASAASIFSDIDRLAPQSPWGPHGQAVFAIRQERWADAKRLSDLSIERDAAFVPGLILRSQLARRDNDARSEESLLLRAVACDNDQGEVWWRLAELSERAQRHIEARQRSERAWPLSPQRERALRLAKQAESNGDREAAALWLHRATAP